MAHADGRIARALVYIDAGIAQADPELRTRISAWFQQRPHLELAALPKVVIGGEAIKNQDDIIDTIGRECLEANLCRHSYVIIIGGGAVLDAVGCAATLTHRGLRQIRLPTTTLAQNDAGLGVKNAINRFGNKNYFGTFTAPWAIINDRRFIELLPDRQWREGISEAVKVAIIKDRSFLDWIVVNAPELQQRNESVMDELIRRCALLHLDHITQGGDPFERGSSRPLDFGHWSAHRLEILSQHELSHGEAVAIGVALDCFYAAGIGRITKNEAEIIAEAIALCGLPLWHDTLNLRTSRGERQVIAGLEQFREHLGGVLTLAMPDGLGNRQDIGVVDYDLLEQALHSLRRVAVRCQATLRHRVQEETQPTQTQR